MISTLHEEPQLFFFCELSGAALLRLLDRPDVLNLLAARAYGVALALSVFDDGYAAATRLLNTHDIPVVAWLTLPADEGLAFNLQNYPRAAACYQAFHAWAQANGLRFVAVGFDMEPPLSDALFAGWGGAREIVRRIWLARDNALFPAARAAYLEVMAVARRDGYEVHAYQIPLIADDRRVGTTLLQRALDIVDLPADIEVLMCLSETAPEWFGSALIAVYGPSADALAVGSSGSGDAILHWDALRHNLLLAAACTDIIYVATLEQCVANGHLERIAALDWGTPVRVAPLPYVVLWSARLVVLIALIIARYGKTALAWLGWVIALLLWLRRRYATAQPTPGERQRSDDQRNQPERQ
ncbi:hypothetical protein [Roseiflexus sp.]|uniref:hypothetical protein n=1 Tax=Roseiflexus sp. TaxID=2562120 RepID=UPI0021DD029E|nr:hypothetical protein [Roseiflexus sp.]GIW02162.1 MAG: hypothetical protein KatS3mg058_3565 [Roseiflexus sp.]